MEVNFVEIKLNQKITCPHRVRLFIFSTNSRLKVLTKEVISWEIIVPQNGDFGVHAEAYSLDFLPPKYRF